MCPSSKQPGSPEHLPSLFKQVSTEVGFGFDTTPSPGTDPSVENVSYDFNTVFVNMVPLAY